MGSSVSTASFEWHVCTLFQAINETSVNSVYINDVVDLSLEACKSIIDATELNVIFSRDISTSEDLKDINFPRFKSNLFEGAEIFLESNETVVYSEAAELCNKFDNLRDRDTVFQRDHGGESGGDLRNFISVPILYKKKKIGTLFGVDVGLKKSVYPFTLQPEDCKKLFAAIGNCISTSLHHVVTCQRFIIEQSRSKGIPKLTAARLRNDSLDKIFQIASDTLHELIDADMISIYLCDHVKRECYVCVSKDPSLCGLTLPFETGVSGYVASTGKVICLEDAYDSAHFSPCIDVSTGNRTKTMLTVPVVGGKERLPLALIQAINKLNGQIFTPNDEEKLTNVARELSLVLELKLADLQGYRESSQITNGRKVVSTKGTPIRRNLSKAKLPVFEVEVSSKFTESMLKDFGLHLHQLDDPLDSQEASDRLETERSAKSSAEESEVFPSSVADGILNDYNANVWKYTEGELVELLVAMFRNYGLIEKYDIDVDILRNFLWAVRALYFRDNPFHNFRHVWAVTHTSYQILRKGTDKFLNSLDILSLLIASVCHDVDHPGHNNAFEVALRTPLAILYSDDAVLERHHSALTIKLLGDPDINFLKNLSESDRTYVRQAVYTTIMGTDMSHHFPMVDRLSALTNARHQVDPFDPNNKKSRDFLLQVIIHCADLGAQTQCLDLAKEWTTRVTTEFAQQATKEEQHNVMVTPFMKGLDDIKVVYRLQVGFISNIVLPIWLSFTECFPELKEPTKQLSDNKNYYLTEIDH